MVKLKVLDLFAGAGGLSCGFEQTACFEIAAAVENNKEAAATYQANHSSTVMYDDIKKINFNKPEFQNIQVIIGGPPCQGFSNANRHRNTLISDNNQLVKEFVRAVEEINPTAFVMENVDSMESEKHKFFCRPDDENELQELNIALTHESIPIGRAYPITPEMINFINAQTPESLAEYIVSDNILSKLKSIFNKLKNRNEKKLIEYLNKKTTKQFIQKLAKQYQHIHRCWCSKYQQQWENLVQQLILFADGTGTTPKLDLLETIIDINTALKKSLEIKKHEIEAVYRLNGSGQLVVDVNTYSVYEYLKAKFQQLNYVIEAKVLNAAEYGAPQVRRRLFIIGVKREALRGQALKFPPEKIFCSEEDYYTIADAIKDLENTEPETDINSSPQKTPEPTADQDRHYWRYLNNKSSRIYNHVVTKSTETSIKRFKALKPGQNFHDLDDKYKDTYSDISRTQNTIYKRLSYNEASGTVLNVRKSMWIHPSKVRAISIREAARLQSFQDTYIFLGNKNSQYQQVGNAVPPLLARAVAESLLDTLGIDVPERLKDILKKPLKNEQISLF